MPISNLGAPFFLPTIAGGNRYDYSIWRVGAGGNGANFVVTSISQENFDPMTQTADLSVGASFIYPAISNLVPMQSAAHTLVSYDNVNVDDSDVEVGSIATRAGGGFVAAMADNTGSEIELRFVSSAGIVDFVVDFTPAANHSQFDPVVTLLDNGNYLLTYTDVDMTGGSPVDAESYGQIIGADGSLIGGQFVVNGNTTDANGGGDTIALGNGLVHVYNRVSFAGGFANLEIRARLMDANGAANGADVLVATMAGGTTETEIEVVSLAHGGFAVFWLERGDDPEGNPPPIFNSNWAVRGAFFDAAGTQLSSSTITSGTYGFDGTNFTGVRPPEIDTTDLANGSVALAIQPMGQGFMPNGPMTVHTYNLAGAIIATDSRPQANGGGFDFELGEDGRVLYSSGGGVQYLDFSANSVNGSNTADDVLYGDRNVDDFLIGNGGNDILRGLSGFDLLRGGLGADTLDGGADFDTVDYSQAANDLIVTLTDTADANGDLLGSASFGDVLISIERIRGGLGNDSLTGNSEQNIIRGNEGNDTIDGGGMNADGDLVDYASATGQVIVTLTDAVNGSGQFLGSATGFHGNDTLIDIESIIAGSGNDSLTGNSLNNFLRGLAGNDTVDGGAGIDTADYRGASGSVIVTLTDGAGGVTGGASSGAAGADTLINIENIRGGYYNDVLTGNSFDNAFRDMGGDDTFNGGGGADRVSYFDANGSVIAILTDETVPGGQTSGFASGASGNDVFFDIENLQGSQFDDFLQGNSRSNFIQGGDGRDTMEGGGGFDFASYSFAPEPVFANLSNSAFNTGYARGDQYSSIEGLRGSAYNDTLTGDSGFNILIGGAGADSLDGGAGDHDAASYAFATSAVNVSLANPASNTGEAAGDVFANIEALIGSQFNDSLTGDGAANDLYGGAGADTLDGGGGNDLVSYRTLSGIDPVNASLLNPAGNTGDAAGDVYVSIEGLGGGRGNDTLSGDNNANSLYGEEGNDSLSGNAGHDSIDGGSGNDQINGGAGNDTMAGGFGNDTITVDSAGDVVVEAIGGGVDRVNTSVNYILAAGVEIETLVNINVTGLALTGNEFNNNIIGAAANDTLNGGNGNDPLDGRGGIDSLAGGGAIDWYYVDNAGDIVIESTIAGGGSNDRVNASVNWTLGAGQQVEEIVNLLATGLNLTGNELDNRFFGNSGADTLNGGAGADTIYGQGGADSMVGGAGNDIYFVDNAGDVVIENTSEGVFDRIYTSINYTVAAGQEIDDVLVLAGSGSRALTGNEFTNRLYGDAGNDTLTVNGGNDYIDGRGGNDVLSGGTGIDTVVGGVGNDVFILSALQADRDIFPDFNFTQDRFEVSNAAFGGGLDLDSNGVLDANRFVANATGTATTADHRFIYMTGANLLIYDSNGSAAGGVNVIGVVTSSGISAASFNVVA